MLPIARLNDTHICPMHGKNKIITAQGIAASGDKPVACVGDKTTCGAVIVVGSSVASINGKPVAYLGSKTSHGGIITTGSDLFKVLP